MRPPNQPGTRAAGNAAHAVVRARRQRARARAKARRDTERAPTAALQLKRDDLAERVAEDGERVS